jgi:bromodomain-containing protein 4
VMKRHKQKSLLKSRVMSSKEMKSEPDSESEIEVSCVQPSVIPGPTKRRRNTNQMQFLLKLLKNSICLKRCAKPFLRPLDYTEVIAEDYHKIIKNPIDLATIRKRLQNCYYSSITECLNDFYTLFSNCYRYNRPEDEVFIDGQTLEKFFREKIESMPTEEEELPLTPIVNIKPKRKTRRRGLS